MATRAEINRKYGVSRLMPPDIANEELSPEQEALYERQMKLISEILINLKLIKVRKADVIVWMPLPEPYREGEPPKQTNADRSQSMTDEELADFLVTMETFSYHDQSISGTYEMKE